MLKAPSAPSATTQDITDTRIGFEPVTWVSISSKLVDCSLLVNTESPEIRAKQVGEMAWPHTLKRFRRITSEVSMPQVTLTLDEASHQARKRIGGKSAGIAARRE